MNVKSLKCKIQREKESDRERQRVREREKRNMGRVEWEALHFLSLRRNENFTGL